MPRSFRGERPSGEPELEGIEKYRARSMIEEYRVVAIVFALIFVALTAYFIKSLMRGHPAAPAPVQSVYIDPVTPPPANPPPQ